MLFSIRNRKKMSPEVSASSHLASSATPLGQGWDEPPPSQDEEDGLPLPTYAVTHNLSEAEVWRRIKRGELIARPVQGRLLVWCPQALAAALSLGRVQDKLGGSDATLPSDLNDAPLLNLSPHDQGDPNVSADPWPESTHQPQMVIPRSDQTLADMTGLDSHLPPLPKSADFTAKEGSFSAERQGAVSIAESESAKSQGLTATHATTELALLIDHLSLAKDENREILRLAQDSIRKVTELSDTLVAMKDAVIEAKDTQILSLKDLLSLREKEIRTLKQSHEDLEMLARALASQSATNASPSKP